MSFQLNPAQFSILRSCIYLTQVLLLHMNFALHFGLDFFWGVPTFETSPNLLSQGFPKGLQYGFPGHANAGFSSSQQTNRCWIRSPEHVVAMAIVFLGDAIDGCSILQLLCCLSQDVQKFMHSRWCRIYQQYCQYTQ